MRALISIALLQFLVVVVVVSNLLMTNRRGSQLSRRRGRRRRRRIFGVELCNLSHLPIRRKTFAPQRDPPGRPFCSDLQRDLFVSGENLSNTAAAAANRWEIDRKISKSTTVMMLLLLCATRAPLSVLLLFFATCVCVITQSKVTSTATVIIIFVLSLGVATRLPGVTDFVRRRRWRF
jgi:hypothetical protein